ncbi:hypothetical protein HYV82_05355 [Candidatus Woesearchaeota archaeon]|nr:hypothetical protein [Candidatus Woesearchaeota archaeon]
MLNLLANAESVLVMKETAAMDAITPMNAPITPCVPLFPSYMPPSDMPYPYAEAYPEGAIATASEGVLITKGLTGCLAVLLYTEKDGKPFASMGHHLPPLSRNDLDVIIQSWAVHRQQHPELTEYDSGQFVVARDRHCSYGRRTIGRLVQELQPQHPAARVVVVKYEVPYLYPYQPLPASFSCDLESMTWNTNVAEGRLKPRRT